MQIHQRLAVHPQVELLTIPEALRKDTNARKNMMEQADAVFLCLPDEAAREAVRLAGELENKPRLIDASTAHRTQEDWAYGLPELSKTFQERIGQSSQVAVPGCHATAFLLPLYPLIQEGWLPRDYPLTSQSITGYTGGGKAMVQEYEAAGRPEGLDSPRAYALGLWHKHLPEMKGIAGLTEEPAFLPVVSDFPRGLAVFTLLHQRFLGKKAGAQKIHAFLSEYYEDQTFVKVMPFEADRAQGSPFLDIQACNGTNRAELLITGNEERILLACRLDNLGKGASGAAIQNMNLMFGLAPETGFATRI